MLSTFTNSANLASPNMRPRSLIPLTVAFIYLFICLFVYLFSLYMFLYVLRLIPNEFQSSPQLSTCQRIPPPAMLSLQQQQQQQRFHPQRTWSMGALTWPHLSAYPSQLQTRKGSDPILDAILQILDDSPSYLLWNLDLCLRTSTYLTTWHTSLPLQIPLQCHMTLAGTLSYDDF